MNPVKSAFRQVLAAVFKVTVTAPEAASKKQLSEAVGTACPPAPPLVNAHLVPAVASQFAVPPTQYLSAASASDGATKKTHMKNANKKKNL